MNLFSISIVLYLSSLANYVYTTHSGNVNQENMVYFSETAFYENSWLSRWEKPIKVQCLGNYSNIDIQKINEFIKEIRPELGNTSIELVDKGGNLFIHFDADLSNFDQSPIFKNDKVPLGYMKPFLNKQHAFIKADIFIHPTLVANKKYEVLRHEFCHSLGLMSHTYRAYNSQNLLGKIIFKNAADYHKWQSTQNIPDLDKLAIRILYQEGLPLNYSKKQFQTNYIKNNAKSHFIASAE